jgi:hypothetical protein
MIPLSKKAKFKLYLNLEWIFDRFSHEYSFKNYIPEEHPVRTYTKLFLLHHIKTTDTILDLGCYAGDMSIYLSDKAKKVVGIDYNNVAITAAKKKYNKSNLNFICSDAYEYLNSSHETFDVIIMSHILEHLDDPESFLKKYTPFFKHVYIELPDFDKTLLNQYRKDHNLSLIYTDGDHVSEFDRFELQDLIKRSNLEIISSEYMYGIQKIWCNVKS